MRRGLAMAGAAALIAGTAFVGVAQAAAAQVYGDCTSAGWGARATDVNGVPVLCDALPSNTAFQTLDWVPLLDLGSNRPWDSGGYQPCPVPGLVANRSGGISICEHHFNGLYYWPR